jgi:hypothetical protein
MNQRISQIGLENKMAKGQKRSSREAKKPKSAKKPGVVAVTSYLSPPKATTKPTGTSR